MKRRTAYREPLRSEMYERLRLTADEQPMVVGCMHCPDWVAEGTAAATKAAQLAHRQEFHPETFRLKSKRTPRRVFAERNMTREREERIEEERRQRMRQLGIPA